MMTPENPTVEVVLRSTLVVETVPVDEQFEQLERDKELKADGGYFGITVELEAIRSNTTVPLGCVLVNVICALLVTERRE